MRVRGGDDKEHSFEVGGLVGTRAPFDLAGGNPGFHLLGGFGSDDEDFGSGVEQAGDFALGDGAGADDEAGPARELEAHGKETRGRSLLWDGLHPSILAEIGNRRMEIRDQKGRRRKSKRDFSEQNNCSERKKFFTPGLQKRPSPSGRNDIVCVRRNSKEESSKLRQHQE